MLDHIIYIYKYIYSNRIQHSSSHKIRYTLNNSLRCVIKTSQFIEDYKSTYYQENYIILLNYSARRIITLLNCLHHYVIIDRLTSFYLYCYLIILITQSFLMYYQLNI